MAYQNEVAERGARIARVLAEAQPGDSLAALAQRAGVSRQAIHQARHRQSVDRAKRRPLRKLYRPDVAYWERPAVRAVEKALGTCSRGELAYLLAEVFPIFEMNVRNDASPTWTDRPAISRKSSRP